VPDFDLPRFIGTWYVVASTFPMWSRGDRTRPRIHYGQLPGPRQRMSDNVTFLKRGRRRRIAGTDTRLPRPGVAFRWRGRGLLSPLTSDWRVVELDADYQWAVISFSRSLFTPAGLDIIARQPALSEPVMRHILGLVGESDGLVEVAQD
jgi:lipocalin